MHMRRSSFRRIAQVATGIAVACGVIAAYDTPEEAYIFLGASVLLAIGIWYSYRAKDGYINSAKGYDPEPGEEPEKGTRREL
jgi:uncharacterized membrane protein